MEHVLWHYRENFREYSTTIFIYSYNFRLFLLKIVGERELNKKYSFVSNKQ